MTHVVFVFTEDSDEDVDDPLPLPAQPPQPYAARKRSLSLRAGQVVSPKRCTPQDNLRQYLGQFQRGGFFSSSLSYLVVEYESVLQENSMLQVELQARHLQVPARHLQVPTRHLQPANHHPSLYRTLTGTTGP